MSAVRTNKLKQKGLDTLKEIFTQSTVEPYRRGAEDRTGRLGASDVPQVTGTAPWGSPRQVWELKTGRKQFTDNPTDAMYWGLTLEPVVLKHYLYATGSKKIMAEPKFTAGWAPWATATPDAICTTPKGDIALVEVKTSLQYSGWPTVPAHYVEQCHWQMMVTGGLKPEVRQVTIPVLHAGRNFEIHTVDYDPELANHLYKTTKHFWEHNVGEDIRPEPSGNDLEILLAEDQGDGMMDSDPHIYNLICDLYRWREAKGKAEREEKGCRARVLDWLQANNAKAVNDPETSTMLLDYRENRRKQLDTKKVKQDFPLDDSHYKTVVYRTLEINTEHLTKG